MLRYKDLTDEQKKVICNGCGGKGGWIKPPNFIFKASCNHHDFKYWQGGTEKDREIADKEFYKWMRADIADAVWYKQPHYHVWAYLYYLFVRGGGKDYFYLGEPRGLCELHDEMFTKDVV